MPTLTFHQLLKILYRNKKAVTVLKKIYYKFISLKSHWQIGALFLFSALIISVFTSFFGFETSLKVFLDPGNFDANVGIMILLELGLLLAGILLSGMIVGSIVNGFEKLSKDSELYNVNNVIKEAFETVSSIKTRKLLKELGLVSRTRMYDLQEAEIRLEIPREDILAAIRSFGQCRLRMMKNTKNIVIEDFNSSTKYGCFVDKKNNLTLISTQNYSDAGIGHFTSILAENLASNYISNEFYSTGAPLKSKHINFANNEAYIDFNRQSEHETLNAFKSDLSQLLTSSNLVVYLATSNGERENDVHIVFGGEKGQTDFDIKTPIYKNVNHLIEPLSVLHTDLSLLSLKLATHQEFGNIADNHLTRSIYRETGTDALIIYISTKILWSGDDIQYYSVMKAIYDFISAVKGQ